MKQLVLIRHGQSEWNKANRFTGWVDVELSEQGVQEAQQAGKILLNAGFKFDTLLTSKLKRAQKTASIIQESMNSNLKPLEDWRLNERHYGALQGKNKKETAQIHGAEQVKIWRRSYDTPPPPLEDTQATHPADWNAPNIVGESLKDTFDRVVPYYNDTVVPALQADKKILIAAHGNSLRALMKHLFKISDEDILALEIATGTPIVVFFDDHLDAEKFELLK